MSIQTSFYLFIVNPVTGNVQSMKVRSESANYMWNTWAYSLWTLWLIKVTQILSGRNRETMHILKN